MIGKSFKLLLSSVGLGSAVSLLGFAMPSDVLTVMLGIVVCEGIESVLTICVFPRIQKLRKKR